MSRRKGFLTDVITDVVLRFWTLGIIPPAQNEEITVGWSDLLAPSQAEKIANMDKLADVAVKSTNALAAQLLLKTKSALLANCNHFLSLMMRFRLMATNQNLILWPTLNQKPKSPVIPRSKVDPRCRASQSARWSATLRIGITR
jgi:hypothetical protein